MVDFTRYQPPGVYVEDATSPIVNTTGVAPSVVCIVGAALGYQTYTETVAASTTAGVVLTETGIYSEVNHSTAIADMTVKLTDGTTLVEGTGAGTYDYTLAYDATSKLTTLTLNVGGTNLAGNTAVTVVCSYTYTATTYFDPARFTDYQSVSDTYGDPLVSVAPATPTASQVASPLSLAAKVAFENGATELVLVPLDPSVSTLAGQLTDALSKVIADDTISVVVPVLDATFAVAPLDEETYLALAQVVDTHCTQASTDGNPRIGIIGLLNGVTLGGTADGQGAAKALAGSLSSNRMVVAYPEALNLYNGLINSTTTVDGIYLAAAYAGRLEALPQQKALTKEVIRSFNGIPASIQRIMTKTNKNALSSGGVAVTEIDRQGNLTVRHGVSSDMSSVLTREVSITRARDALTVLLQDGLDNAGLIGNAITVDTPVIVQSAVTGILENAKQSGLIIDYASVAVREQALPSGDPTVLEVKFAYKPALPLNYVVVSFSIDMSTGDTTLSGVA